MMGWDGWGFGWLGMSLMMLVVWGVPIALVVWLILGNLHPGQAARSTPRSSADQILADRYARGEIDEEEFTRRSEVLHQGPRALS